MLKLLLACFLVLPLAAVVLAEESTLRLTFVGDIMLDGGPGHHLANGQDPFAPCAEILKRADFTIGNLECVIGRGGEQLNKAYVFRGAIESPPFLKKHFDALSLANNHSYDFGPDGLKEMIGILQAHKIPYFGAGANLAEARTPLVLEAKGYRIGLLGYNEFRADNYAATETQFGNAPYIEEYVLQDIQKAKKAYRCDLVIPFLHWGEELEPFPRPDNKFSPERWSKQELRSSLEPIRMSRRPSNIIVTRRLFIVLAISSSIIFR